MTPAHLDARRRKDLPRRASLYGAAFLLPVALLCLLSAMRGVYPFGPESFLTEDLKYQYIDFFHWYRKVLTGQESLFYSFSTSLGNNAWGLWSYYLASPLNLLVLLFPDDLMTLAVFLISAIKLGLTGVTTTFYLRNRFSLGAPMSLALALSFSCSLWSLTQLRNPLWMDALVLLPLVALGARRCVLCGRWGALVASLCASILCCWYMGYMTVPFSVLYAYVEWLAAGPGPGRLAGGRAFSRLSGALCVTLLLSAWTLYPTVAAQLGGWTAARTIAVLAASAVLLVLALVLVRDLVPARIAAAAGIALLILLGISAVAYVGTYALERSQGAGLGDIVRSSLTSSPRSVLAGIFFGTWRINLVPQLFPGSLPLLGSLCLLLCRRIAPRARAIAVGFLMVLLLGSALWPLYLMWCGFRAPNGFYCRTSFLFVFGAIWATGLYLSQRGDARRHREVLAAAPLLVAASTACSLLGTDPELPTLLVGDCLIVACALLLLPRGGRAAAALPVLAFVELLASGSLAWPSVYVNYAQADYDAYYDGAKEELEAIREYDGDVYRVEKTHTRAGMAALNEGLAMGFDRISSYSSAYNAAAVGFLSELGYSNPGEFSVAYRTPVLPSDSLLGVRYVISRHLVNQLESVDLVGLADGDSLYRNPDALSLGYAVSSSVTADLADSSDPFEAQNSLASAVLGHEVTLYRPLDATLVGDDEGTRTWEVTIPAGELGCSWVSSGSGAGYLYVVDDPTAQWANDSGFEGLAWDNWRFGHAVRMLGDVSDSDRKVRVSLKRDIQTSPDEGPLPDDARCVFYALDMSAYDELVANLSEEQLQVAECKGSSLSGTLAASGEKDGMLITVPYDIGWTVRLDGERVDAQPAFGGALTYVAIDEPGTHRLEMSYVPPMLVQGSCVMLASAASLLAMRAVTRRSGRVEA